MADTPTDNDTGVDVHRGATTGTSHKLMHALREIKQTLRASPVFTLAALLTLGTAGVIGLMTFGMILQPGFLGMAHFSEPSHRTHELMFGFLFGVAGVGLLAQFRRPSKTVAGMLMALIPWAGLLLAAVLSTDMGRVILFNPSRLVTLRIRPQRDHRHGWRRVGIVLRSVDTRHDFKIDELNAQVAAGRGETATGGFRADRPGRYAFYCSIPGHRQAGMEGTLIVEGTDDGTRANAPDVVFTLVPIIHIGAFVDARDTSVVDPNPTLRVPLGSVVQVTLENHVGGQYDIYFPDFEAKSERVVGGSSTSIVFVADKEGEFVYYSTVPGHREAGLEGRFVVGE